MTRRPDVRIRFKRSEENTHRLEARAARRPAMRSRLLWPVITKWTIETVLTRPSMCGASSGGLGTPNGLGDRLQLRTWHVKGRGGAPDGLAPQI